MPVHLTTTKTIGCGQCQVQSAVLTQVALRHRSAIILSKKQLSLAAAILNTVVIVALKAGCDGKNKASDDDAPTNGQRAGRTLYEAFSDVTDPDLQALVNRAVLRFRSGQSSNRAVELQILSHRPGLTSNQLFVVSQLLERTKLTRGQRAK